MKPLRTIWDNYPKVVLTLDRFTTGNYEGIQVLQVIDWLLGQHTTGRAIPAGQRIPAERLCDLVTVRRVPI